MTKTIVSYWLALLLSTGGCGAAKSALGVLSPKPPEQRTVVTVITAPAASAPAPSPAPTQPERAHRGPSRTTTIVEAALAGAVAGAAVAFVLREI